MKINLTSISSRMSSIATLIVSGGLSLWTSAQAQTGPPGQLPPVTNLSFLNISTYLCVLVGWMFTILVILTVIFVIIAGYKYLTAGGDEEKIKSANHQLIYAAIAIAVGLLSRAIPFLVGNFLAAGSFQGC